MKNRLCLLFALIIALMLHACGGAVDTSIIAGQVVESNTGDPIENAFVEVLEPEEFQQTATTDSTGSFSFDIDPGDETVDVTIEISKQGYESSTTNFKIANETNVDDLSIELLATDSDGNEEDPIEDSDGSAYLSLENVSHTNIQVTGTGGIETSDLIFVVTDSSGVPVSDEEAEYVNFEILEGPEGTSVYPDSALTDNGEATATIKSGTESGVVQVRASFTREEITQSTKTTLSSDNNVEKTGIEPGNSESGSINNTSSTSNNPSPRMKETVTHESKPVQIAIHGGLPSTDHFTIKSEVQNMALTLGEENTITVDLGDKYGNDVPVGTKVSFKTEPNMGTISGSAETDENGIASALLQTGSVAGISTITAETIDESSQTINKQVDVLFSGSPNISINPENVSLEDFTNQTFNYTVADKNGNPLAPGTSISITTDNDTLALRGDTNVELDDVIKSGNGTTDFKFNLSNPDKAIITDNANLEISVDGPNGSASKSVLLGAADAPNTNAGNITLESISEDEIGVVNTGQTEQSQLNFVITDSTGQPMGSNNPAEVSFRVANNSPSGADVSPRTDQTNANGEVSTTVTSGTEAGVVQVIAETEVNGTTIKSQPIAVTIHSGLPSQEHFTIAGPDTVVFGSGNKPSYNIYAGDKHSNIVPEETPIHFTTTGGYIEGSAQTDGEGEASARLTPQKPFPDNGIATVTAETKNDQEETISESLEVNFVQNHNLAVDHSSLNLEGFESETFSYTFEDDFGNPIFDGSTVDVSVDKDDLTLSGDTDLTLDKSNEDKSFSFELANPDEVTFDEGGFVTITAGSVEKKIKLEADGLNPGSIILESVSHEKVGVVETGQNEQAELTFQVTDKSGRPLDQNNQTDVTFSLGASPGGQEDVYPKTATTDANGQATTTLTSGTEAGVVQVLAEITTNDGSTITSQPVQVAIHAGLPDQDHFTVESSPTNVFVDGDGTPKVNVTAYAGDKHGNIVPEGTSIYFTTDGGYISGSSQTNANGEATATLTAANPIPGNGIATITAETADDNNITIATTTEVTFSGTPNITLTPDPFTINDGDKEDFTYTVTDANNNAMPIGTTIEVEAVGGDFELEDSNDGEVIVGSSNDTQFGFTVYDADPGNVTDDTFYITITVTVPPHEGQESETVIQQTFDGTKAKTR